MDAPTTMVMTMVRNESFMLPRWLEHYGTLVGKPNLVVVDDATTDGSTTGLDVTVLRLPRDGKRDPSFDAQRARMVSALGTALLHYADIVIYVDVDEFLVIDPWVYQTFEDFLRRVPDNGLVAPLGLNLLHVQSREGRFDSSRHILEQRRFVKFVPAMCKPVVRRSAAARWTPGFHGATAPYSIDPGLLLIHAKFLDVTLAATQQKSRHALWHEGMGQVSSWRMPAGRLKANLAVWSTSAEGETISEFDAARLDLADVVHKSRLRLRGPRLYRSLGGQIAAMRDMPVLELPPRFEAHLHA